LNLLNRKLLPNNLLDSSLFLVANGRRPDSDGRWRRRSNRLEAKYGWSNMRSVRLTLGYIFLFLLGCGVDNVGHLVPGQGDKAITVFVDQALDGDTIRVKRPIRWSENGKPKRITRIRYIGVDTPEHNDPFWRAARALNKSLVYRKRVRLEFDRERTDRYNRLLAYVYVDDDVFVNAEVVKRGYARAYPVEPNTRYEKLFRQLEDEARADGRGMWSTLADLTPAAPEETESANPIERKYIASRNSEVFHLPSCKWAKRISEGNMIYFTTYQEAIDSGRRPCRVCYPMDEEDGLKKSWYREGNQAADRPERSHNEAKKR